MLLNCNIITIALLYSLLATVSEDGAREIDTERPFPTIIITQTINRFTTSYNESIINQTVEKLYRLTMAAWKNVAEFGRTLRDRWPFYSTHTIDIRYALRA